VAGKILKFANDTKIYRTVISENAEDVSALQSDMSSLTLIVAWSKEWQMLFNVEKWKGIQKCHVGYNNLQAEYEFK